MMMRMKEMHQKMKRRTRSMDGVAENSQDIVCTPPSVLDTQLTIC